MMKKILVVFGMLAASVIGASVLASCASTKVPKDVSTQDMVVVEHKGTAFGVAQPEWVATVLSTPNQKTLSKALGITGKKIWVLEGVGKNLDFLKTWVDQVDARAEIAASIRQSVSDFVGANMKAEPEEVEKAAERYSARFANVTLVGLEKETDWWTKTRKKTNDDYVEQYTYMVIYAMDEDLFTKQLKESLKDIEEDGMSLELVTNYVMEQAAISKDMN